MEKQQLERLLKELRMIKDSYAWSYIAQELNEDILRAAYSFGDSATMPVDEMHFRRGAIYATRGMVNLVDRLLVQVENELLLLQANPAAPQPKP